MNGQSYRPRPTYLESGVFHSDATYGRGQANAADAILLPGADAAISARETLAFAFR